MPEPYPKHFLADVPQELRLKLLDLCVRRQYHEAYELLQASGFTHYERYELVWFHDWAPTNLDPERLRQNTPPTLTAPESLTPAAELDATLTQPQTLTAESSNLNL